MNKYEWIRRNHNKNSNFFRFFFFIVVIFVIGCIFFRGCQSIAKDLFGAAKDAAIDNIGKSAYNALVLSEVYEEDLDNYDDSSYAASLVMNTLFPAGEFYMARAQAPEESMHPQSVQAVKQEETTKPVQTESESATETEPETVEEITDEDTILSAASQIIPMDKLLDYKYVMNNFYVVPAVTSLSEETLNLPQLVNTDVTIKKDSSAPQILIFHTHGQEGFADTADNGKTIVDVGNYLTDLLVNKYGYNVMHLTDSFDLVEGVLDRGKAYTYANARLDEVLKDNPSIQVVIDLHRDGVDESKHLVTQINGKQTAKIMLFNGISYTNEQGQIDYLQNPYISENLAMTYKMYLLGEILYPDLIRCIYIQGYRYCLYHMPRSMLIEAGAQTNTFEEVYNAMEPLADMLDRELSKQ